ncbi:helix-turn-helix transcriptional regulator [Erysipelotrichaceae bacterium 51-3]
MDTVNNLGFVEKMLRKKHGFSLDNVSKDLKISKGNLSEMENGRRSLKETLFCQFVEQYKINFDFDLGLLKEAEQLLQELMEAYTYKNVEKERQIKQKFFEQEKKYEYSFACLYLPLIKAFWTHNKKPAEFTVSELDAFADVSEYFSVYAPDEKALFLYLKGLVAKKKRNLNHALHEYSEALDLLNGKKWPQLEGIIKLNYAIALSESSSFFSAYLIGQEASEIFSKHDNYVRALMSSNNQANYLIYLQAYSNAKEILNRVLLSQQSFPGHSFSKFAVSTMLLALVMGEEFEQAIQFAKEYPMDDEDRYVGNRSLLPYCYYRLGEPDQCLLSMTELSQEALTRDDKAFHALLMAILEEDKERIEAAKKKMIRVCCKQLNWAMLMIVYQLLIYYYKSENETDLLIDAYECKDKVCRHILPVDWGR